MLNDATGNSRKRKDHEQLPFLLEIQQLYKSPVLSTAPDLNGLFGLPTSTNTVSTTHDSSRSNFSYELEGFPFNAIPVGSSLDLFLLNQLQSQHHPLSNMTALDSSRLTTGSSTDADVALHPAFSHLFSSSSHASSLLPELAPSMDIRNASNSALSRSAQDTPSTSISTVCALDTLSEDYNASLNHQAKKPNNTGSSSGRIYIKWTDDEIQNLISWWDNDANYANWSSRFKTQSYRRMQSLFNDKTVSQIKNKADGLIKSYNEAMGLLKEASKSPRKRDALTYAQLISQCKYFERMHSVFKRHSECSLEQIVLDQIKARIPPVDASDLDEPVGNTNGDRVESINSKTTFLSSPLQNQHLIHRQFESGSESTTSDVNTPAADLFGSWGTHLSVSTSSENTSDTLAYSALLHPSNALNIPSFSPLAQPPKLHELGLSAPIHASATTDMTDLSHLSTLHSKLLALQSQELHTKQIMAELEIQRLKTWSEALQNQHAVTQHVGGLPDPGVSSHNSTPIPDNPSSLSAVSFPFRASNPPNLSPHPFRYNMLPAVQSLLPKSPDMLGLVQRQEFKARRALMELDLFRINSMLLAMEPPSDMKRSQVETWKTEVQGRYDDVKNELDRLRDLLENKDD
ncbi:hypothetical protein QVD99_004594 [Batrachochytrium dendrobatidis]|nr:hypothetical protein O5D80_002831 [Batrachochytrium dendrobatidis]KAK5668808.1 hypothetical protein QVD99_004594 [Batrachochytrium dendrobatidis]